VALIVFIFEDTSQMNRLIFMWIEIIFPQSFGLSRLAWLVTSVFVRMNCGAYRSLWLNISQKYWRRGMGILALAADERVSGVEVSEDTLTVALMDGRSISVPLAWYPRLFNATQAERQNWQLAGGGYGIHWPDVDEDLSTEGLLRGAPAPRQRLAQV
jgi:hypothetical protein